MHRISFRNFAAHAVRAAILFALAIAWLSTGNRAVAQSSSAGVNGVVTDPNGSVVAGTKVTLRTESLITFWLEIAPQLHSIRKRSHSSISTRSC